MAVLQKEKLQNLSSVTHEGKVVIVATDRDGKIWYTIKQDGFEDNYLNTPPEQRTGWEGWQLLELPQQKAEDQSVIDKETAELTYLNELVNSREFILRSRYKTDNETQAAPVQLVAALGHIYVFRQSTNNTLLVDRFVLDGMTNQLNPKIEVRFKRSKQKYKPTKNMAKGANGLVNVDSLDFRDAEGNFFYEPTTELCLVNNLQSGWFSVVLVPTIENDVHRWHIFAYNGATQKVELTTLRASEEGLFEVKDYTVLEPEGSELVPRSISGIVKRELDIRDVTVTNGLTATVYNVQQEQETEIGKQLIKTATRLMLAIPTDKGVATLDFAIASDGTLSQINATPVYENVIRGEQKEVLLPLDTLEEIKAFADKRPNPQSSIVGIVGNAPTLINTLTGSDPSSSPVLESLAMELENNSIKIFTEENSTANLKPGDRVRINNLENFQGQYFIAQKLNDNAFMIQLPNNGNLPVWEREDENAEDFVFDGMIDGYLIQGNGLIVFCPNHGLESGAEVQITNTDTLNDTYSVTKVSDDYFVIDQKWMAGAVINPQKVTQKRQGIVFDGENDYIALGEMQHDFSKGITIEAWLWIDNFDKIGTILDLGNGCDPDVGTDPTSIKLIFANSYLHFTWINAPFGSINFQEPDPSWVHIGVSVGYDDNDVDQVTVRIFLNGECQCELPFSADQLSGLLSNSKRTNNLIGVSGNFEPSTMDYYFQGKISDLRIWQHSRTEAQIKNSMYLQLTGQEFGLVGYWRMGGISDRKVVDFSVYRNDGTVYGDPYVSAIRLNRKLDNGSLAVKYSNPELFAVTERATYVESFEFKVNNTAINLNNADGKGIKIFTLSYWGKSSRSADEPKPIIAQQSQFESLGDGWYRVACRFVIPEGISVLRSFEIDKVKGDWDFIEIRKHRISLVSDSITETKYHDSLSLKVLADNSFFELKKIVQILASKELEEVRLLKQKSNLETKLNNEALRKEVERLETEIAALKKSEDEAIKAYTDEKNNPLNYTCCLQAKHSGLYLTIPEPSNLDGKVAVQHPFNYATKVSQNMWGFVPTEDGYYRIQAANSKFYLSCRGGFSYEIVQSQLSPVKLQQWKVLSADKAEDGYYTIQERYLELCLSIGYGRKDDGAPAALNPPSGGGHQAWKLIPIFPANTKIAEAFRHVEYIQAQLKQKRQELAPLSAFLGNPDSLKKQLQQVKDNLISVQESLVNMNAGFLERVIQNTPQPVSEICTDAKGLITRGARLGFVNPASRLQALATCEGNVQLTYFDTQGRMRQTNYDATADSHNTTFEQWLPDAERTCLKLQDHANIRLETPIYLNDAWTVETWFAYPLPFDLQEWLDNKKQGNVLISAVEDDFRIVVRANIQLGVMEGFEFHDSGFDLTVLASGWHHLAVVGRKNITIFYIDGKPVGEVKITPPTESDSNYFHSYLPRNVCTIGEINNAAFGKIAELRIWGIALSDDEIAINSKILLTGNEPDLLAYYPMTEVTGNTIRDQTGHGYDFTIHSGGSWYACSAPIGHPGTAVMQFDGEQDYVEVRPDFNPINTITVSIWAKSDEPVGNADGCLVSKRDAYILHLRAGEKVIGFDVHSSGDWRSATFTPTHDIDIMQWHHYTGTFNGTELCLYIDGVQVAKNSLNFKGTITKDNGVLYIGKDDGKERYFKGQLAGLSIWRTARTQAEIQADMHRSLSGKEANLIAYYPLNEIKLDRDSSEVFNLVNPINGIVKTATLSYSNTLPVVAEALVCNEYTSITLSPSQGKIAMMRRFFAFASLNQVTLLPDQRVETLELKWIGNAQFAPTLLGYIEGAPPVPSENLTVEDDYNGATSVELSISEDVAFSWNRSVDRGLGVSVDAFGGGGGKMSILTAPLGVGSSIETTNKLGLRAVGTFGFQFQNASNITSSSALSMTDKLELRGTPETTPKFPHLGNRFVPKNVGYALVVSALADVFITRLARSGIMVGYQVQPADGIPPDVNTITFLINPAYTKNGTLDGLTGSRASDDRFFRHVPEMRAQYGSLYPASYYRLQEAYNLKRAIEAEDKRREAYFANYNVRSFLLSVDSYLETVPTFGLINSLGNFDIENSNSEAPTTVTVDREEDKPDQLTTTGNKPQAQNQDQKVEQFMANTAASADQASTAVKLKQAEIQRKISDQEKRAQATNSFEDWQKRMESIQIRAGKRNIVNTYVWDADGGLRSEAQSFASTVEHCIGGSTTMDLNAGIESAFNVFGLDVELKIQGTVNLTQTMSKTEARSKGFALNVDISGLEHKGITDDKDNPIMPGEKVDRYRFMSFYLESTTQNFHDFFSYVVDPEWLASNGEEARALRQAQSGKPNKTWRVLHRVTYVERPALMGFGRDIRQLRSLPQKSEEQ